MFPLWPTWKGIVGNSKRKPSPARQQTRPRARSKDVASAIRKVRGKQALTALQASEVRNRAIMESALDGIITINHEGRIIEFNPAAEAIFGYARKAVIGKEMADLIIPPSLREKHRNSFARHLATGVTSIIDKRIEITAMRADGDEFPVELTVTRISLDGPPTFTAFIRDITERKQAEQSIREQARLIETFFKNTFACIVLLDRDFNFLRVNEAYARACHRDVSDFPGHNHFAFYPSAARKIFEEVRATKVRYQVQASPFVFPDHPEWGMTYWDWTLVPILGESGDVELFAFTLNDVTKRKRVEEERRELYERLRDSHNGLRRLARRLIEVQEEERRHLACELHDEIGQALTLAKINIQQAMHVLGEPTAGTHLMESASLLDHTLQQVRNLALDLRPSLLDDLGLGPTLTWLAERHSQASEIAVQVSAESLDIRPAPEIELACYRVAQEALTNAARHARASQVRIELARSGRELVLLIRDNGIGFDMTTMLSRAAEGESIGLLGMQERVTLTGGEMEILSSPGTGTEIRVRFPLSAPGPSRDTHA